MRLRGACRRNACRECSLYSSAHTEGGHTCMSGDIQVSRVVCMQSVNWKVRRATEAATAGFCGQHSALLAVVRGVAPVSRCEAESTWEKESRRGGNFELRGPRISTTAVPPGDEAGPWTCGVPCSICPGHCSGYFTAKRQFCVLRLWQRMLACSDSQRHHWHLMRLHIPLRWHASISCASACMQC